MIVPWIQTPTTMKIMLLPLLLLLAPMSTQAQEDTSRTESRQAIWLGKTPGEGVKLQVTTQDSAGIDHKVDTIRFQTKRKVVRILTESRLPDSTDAALDERLRDLRRERRNLFTYWAGLELGWNNLIDPSRGFDLPDSAGFMEMNAWRSRFFAINFMEQKVEFGSPHAGLFTGLGLEFVNYHLDRNVALGHDRDSVFAFTVEQPAYTKNKLRQIGLRVPLMLEFNTKRAPLPDREALRAGEKAPSFDRKHNVHLAFGVVGSWYFDTMYKVKYRQDGATVKDRSKDDFNLLPYRLSGRVQVGYGGLNLFAEYGLTELFRDGKGPALVPVTAGITLVGFN